jgi:putative transposase
MTSSARTGCCPPVWRDADADDARRTDRELGYEPYEAEGRNSGNSHNGNYLKTVRPSNGEVEVEVPRDRNGEYEAHILKKYQTSSNGLEEKIIAMYARQDDTRHRGPPAGDVRGGSLSDDH